MARTDFNLYGDKSQSRRSGGISPLFYWVHMHKVVIIYIYCLIIFFKSRPIEKNEEELIVYDVWVDLEYVRELLNVDLSFEGKNS